jgi:hypothetical protein
VNLEPVRPSVRSTIDLQLFAWEEVVATVMSLAVVIGIVLGLWLADLFRMVTQ